jgi:hypothetical protein
MCLISYHVYCGRLKVYHAERPAELYNNLGCNFLAMQKVRPSSII